MSGGGNSEFAEDMLALPDTSYMEATSELICKNIPNSSAMCVTAYQNLLPMVEQSAMLAKQYPASRYPRSIDELIRFSSGIKTENEVGDDWLSCASLSYPALPLAPTLSFRDAMSPPGCLCFLNRS